MSKLWRGNSKGVGFATIPRDCEEYFKCNDSVEVSCGGFEPFFAKVKICKKRHGIYFPKEMYLAIAKKEAKLYVEKVDGFYSPVGTDGRVYIPNHIAEELKLATGDIILIEGAVNGSTKQKYCLVKVRDRNGLKEYKITFDADLSKNSGVFRVEKKLQKNTNPGILAKNTLFDYAQISTSKAILCLGMMRPVVVNVNFEISDMAYYLGAYFSDGIKKGFNWGITASTFEQARYYLEMHTKLVPNSNINTFLTFTSKSCAGGLKQSLAERWCRETGINVNHEQARFVETTTDFAPNRNQYGALTIRESRQLILRYYAYLIKALLCKIKSEPESGFDFICGILEGDGCANAKSRGHISIASNEFENKTITDVLDMLKVRHNLYKEGPNKYTVRIGALEIIRNLLVLKDKLFKYYPKRRKRFIERFCNVGAARFILGEQKHAAGRVKAWMVKEGILNSDYVLTSYGEKIKECLIDMRDSINAQ